MRDIYDLTNSAMWSWFVMHCLCPEGAAGPARVPGASTGLERRTLVDRILDLLVRFAVMLSGGGKPDFRR